MIEPSANSAAVFDRYGLSATTGFWGGPFPDDEGTSASVGKRFRDALEQLGGLYSAFGRFLSYRADLLDGASVHEFRGFQVNFPAVPTTAVLEILDRELPGVSGEVANHLETEPLWNTLARTAYASLHQGQRVVVQVGRDPVSEESIRAFVQGLRALSRTELAGVASEEVLTQFRQWLRHGESMERERTVLETLSNYRGESLVHYPRLIPELCSASVLCWHAVEGRRATDLIAEGDQEISVLLASAILEQLYTLSIVDADLDLDEMVVDLDHGLHFRRLGSAVAVLPDQVNAGIKYAAAVVSGNATLSAQKLIRLAISRSSPELEKQLLDEFSGVEPELKINTWFPSSAEGFENNWRALARVLRARPLFLDCLHRNLVAAGYWNSDAVRAGARTADAISEAQWPVVGRLIRTQFGMLMKRETVEEWAVGSGLLMFGALREMNQLIEEMREDDLRLGIDFDEIPARERSTPRSSSGVVLGALLVVFLAGLRWGSGLPKPWSIACEVLAAASLPAMFWALSRIR